MRQMPRAEEASEAKGFYEKIHEKIAEPKRRKYSVIKIGYWGARKIGKGRGKKAPRAERGRT